MNNIIYAGAVPFRENGAPGTVIGYMVTEEVNCCILWERKVDEAGDGVDEDYVAHFSKWQKNQAIEEGVSRMLKLRECVHQSVFREG